jgi:hypothetical protein
LDPNILLRTLFSNILSLYSSLNIKDQVWHPYKTTEKITVLYNLIFTFIYRIQLLYYYYYYYKLLYYFLLQVMKCTLYMSGIKILHFNEMKVAGRSKHELSSLARRPGSWVRIALRVWMFEVCVRFSVFVLSCI